MFSSFEKSFVLLEAMQTPFETRLASVRIKHVVDLWLVTAAPMAFAFVTM